MDTWLDATEAAQRLGVKPATLYAYVSRGQLRRRAGPDGRRSEYHAEDVADLAVRGRRARPVRPSDIVLPTAVTAIGPDGPAYRGAIATNLAGAVGFEAVAEHLWDAAPLPAGSEGTADRRPVGANRAWAVPEGLTQAAQAMPTADRQLGPAAQLPAIMVAARLADPLRADLRPSAVVAAARGLIAALSSAGGGLATGAGSIAARLVATMIGGSDAVSTASGPSPSSDAGTPHPPSPGTGAPRSETGVARPPTDRWRAAVEAVDAALVLLADHELAASTLAARVAASSRCDPYAVVLAGAAVHTGRRHGAASRPMERAIHAIADGQDAAAVLATELGSQGEVPGLGHPLYPHGDPRATRLLELLRVGDLAERCGPVDELLATVERRGLQPPNIDTALAGLTFAIGAPVGSGELIFAVARTAGWIAHALEQYEDPRLLRPRAVYTGA